MLSILPVALALLQAAPEPLFARDPAALPGVTTVCGGRAKDWILEVNGGGVLLGDLDRDGDCDLVVVDGGTLEPPEGRPPRVYLNDGTGRFVPGEGAWVLSAGRWGMGGTLADFDGDGFLDLVVTQWGPDRFFRSLGGEGLEEVPGSLGGSRWGTSAAPLDYDGDGNLDLCVVNYLAFDTERVAPPGGDCTWKGHAVMCGPEGLTPVHDQLFRGKGDGTFEDVTRKAGFRPEVAGFGLGVTTLDHDLDGDVDLYVANDSTANHLWENLGDGTFREVGFRAAVSHDPNGKEQAGMGIGCGDVDGDGADDLFVTNFSGESNAFYQSRGKGRFRERSSRTGLGGPSITTLGWGAGLCDLDLDGDLDAFVLNGHVYPQADRSGTDTSYAQPDQLFRNEGDRFRMEPLDDGEPFVSRAGAPADLDGDGDLDLVVIELDGAVHVLRNRTRSADTEGGPHWLRVQLAGKGGNTHGLGARVEATWAGGRRSAHVRAAGGFQAAVPAEAHFGLGAAERVETLVVTWPSGRVSRLEDVAVDRVLVVEEPDA